jgi:hypothetical protein
MLNYLVIAHPDTAPDDLQEILPSLWQHHEAAHFTVLLTGGCFPWDALSTCVIGSGEASTVTASMAGHPPLKAIHDQLAMSAEPYEGIILFPGFNSAWLDPGVPARLERKFHMPVSVVPPPSLTGILRSELGALPAPSLRDQEPVSTRSLA